MKDLKTYLWTAKTHNEPTWKDAYPQRVITQEAMNEDFKSCLSSDNSLKTLLIPSNTKNLEQGSAVNFVTSPVESDIKKSEAFQAYLASKKERSEVYRRLAES